MLKIVYNYLINFFLLAKLVPLAYGIHKLQISCVVEDEKVSIDWLQETLQEIEDFVRIIIKIISCISALTLWCFYFYCSS